MTTTVALNKSWNSPLTAWNTSSWNDGGSFPSATGEINSDSIAIVIGQNVTGVAATSAIGNTFETNVGFSATGSVGTITLDGDARVSTTGVSGTTALGNVFETQNGISGTTSLGNTFETNVGISSTGSVGSSTVEGDANVSVTGLSGTTALGNTFETNVGVSATASVDSAALGITGTANIEPSSSNLQAAAVVDNDPVVIDTSTRVEVTGSSATTSMGKVLVWGLIVPTQTPNFITIGGTTAPPLQVPSWIDIAA